MNVLLATALHDRSGIPGTVYGSYVHTRSNNWLGVDVESVSGGAGPVEGQFGGYSPPSGS